MGSIDLIALREFNGEARALSKYRRAFVNELRRLSQLLEEQARVLGNEPGNQAQMDDLYNAADRLVTERYKFRDDTAMLDHELNSFVDVCTRLFVVNTERERDANRELDELLRIRA